MSSHFTVYTSTRIYVRHFRVNMVTAIDWCSPTTHDWIWLVSYFWFNGSLRQYFNLFRAVSQRGRKKRKRKTREKLFKRPPTAPTASALKVYPAHRTIPLTIGLRRLSLCKNNKLFGFTLMSRKFNKTTL